MRIASGRQIAAFCVAAAFGFGLNPILICAANSTGGVMGKMIDAQSIVVASANTATKARFCDSSSGTASPWPAWWDY